MSIAEVDHAELDRPRRSASLEALSEELGAPVPPELSALSDRELELLHKLLAEARERQSAALDDAVDHGLRFIPGLIRGAVKLVLFG
jgi:hypothetical protein